MPPKKGEIKIPFDEEQEESPSGKGGIQSSGKRARSPSKETEEKGPESKKAKKNDKFDVETGALERDFKLFGPTPKRGYGKTVALDDHPLLHPQITLLVGPTGSGKTQLALNLMDEILENVSEEKLGMVYVYSGSPSDPALKPLHDDQRVSMFGPDDQEKFKEAMKQHQREARDIMKEAEENGQDVESDQCLPLSILFLDDAGNSRELSPTQKGSDMGEIIIGHRHLGLHIIYAAQRYMLLGKDLRANASLMFVWPTRNTEEMKQIIANLDFDKKSLEKEFKLLPKDSHSFLYINRIKKAVMAGLSDPVIK